MEILFIMQVGNLIDEQGFSSLSIVEMTIFLMPCHIEGSAATRYPVHNAKFAAYFYEQNFS